MENLKNEDRRYSIPYIAHSKMEIWMQILNFILILTFSAILFLPSDGDAGFIFAKIVLGLADVFFFYNWVYSAVLKKSSICLDEQGITLKSYHTKRVTWAELEAVQTYEVNRAVFIGLIAKNRHAPKNLLVQLFRSEYVLSISTRLFADTDPEKLFATISYMIQNAPAEPEQERKMQSLPEEEKALSNRGALFRAFGVFLLTSAVNLLIAAVTLDGNSAAVSLLGALGVVFIYNKYYEGGRVPFLHRILLGVFSALPALLAPLFLLVLGNRGYLELYGLWETVRLSVRTMIRYPGENVVYYWVAAVLFLFASLSGLNLKPVRRIKKIFMKQRNGFYLKKSGRYFLVYLIDYADFDEDLPKALVEIPAGFCLIERDRKEIGAFYLPAGIFQDLQVRVHSLQRVRIEGNDYFKLDLGGHGKPVPYGYNCLLIINEEHDLEVIRIEKS